MIPAILMKELDWDSDKWIYFKYCFKFSLRGQQWFKIYQLRTI